MIYSVLAYFDKETEKFNPPMFFPFGEADAIETVKDGVKKGKIEGASAFKLYSIGSYDTATAEFEIKGKAKEICDLADYVREGA